MIKYINIGGDRMVRYGGFEAFLGRQSCKILGGQTLTLSLSWGAISVHWHQHQLGRNQQDYLDVHQSQLCFENFLKSRLYNFIH